jgi:tricorn protease-like protein
VEKDDFKQTHLWVIDAETLDAEPELLFTLPEKGADQDEKAQDKKDKSQRLTEGNFHVSDPRWSPDGKQIAFVSSPSPKANDTMFHATIQILNVETKALRKLTGYDGGESAPRWSPDGKWIAFLHSPEGYGQRDLHITSAEGGASTNLTSDFDRNTDTPIWSPDGEVIYFGAMDGVRRHLYAVSPHPSPLSLPPSIPPNLGGEGGAGRGEGGEGSFAPHSGQNFAPGGGAAPH